MELATAQAMTNLHKFEFVYSIRPYSEQWDDFPWFSGATCSQYTICSHRFASHFCKSNASDFNEVTIIVYNIIMEYYIICSLRQLEVEFPRSGAT